MKTIFLTIAISVISLFSIAQNTLTIEITNLKTNNGTVMIALYDADEKEIKKVKGKVENNICTVQINDLPTGTYAVKYYHDENDNGEMDTGMFGKPEEGYGYSNDARGFMGPADFEDQIFELKEDLKISLKTAH
jgi:uncharacterized protein (DUF2141 family)